MKTRIISAVVLLVLVIGCFVISPVTKALLVMVAAVLAAWEMCHAISEMGTKCANAVLYVFIIAAGAAIYFGADSVVIEALFFLAIFACVASGVLCKDIRGKGALGSLAVLVYPVVPMLIILKLAISETWIPVFALGCISAWACDAFALFGGKWFGKNKLAPEVSPNKTIEGSICGAISAVIAGDDAAVGNVNGDHLPPPSFLRARKMRSLLLSLCPATAETAFAASFDG